MADPGKKRIFLVDDHPAFRAGMRAILAQEEDLEICGEAPDARAALAAIPEARPDLALVDISLPGRSGLELIKDLKALQPSGRGDGHGLLTVPASEPPGICPGPDGLEPDP